MNIDYIKTGWTGVKKQHIIKKIYIKSDRQRRNPHARSFGRCEVCLDLLNKAENGEKPA